MTSGSKIDYGSSLASNWTLSVLRCVAISSCDQSGLRTGGVQVSVSCHGDHTLAVCHSCE